MARLTYEEQLKSLFTIYECIQMEMLDDGVRALALASVHTVLTHLEQEEHLKRQAQSPPDMDTLQTHIMEQEVTLHMDDYMKLRILIDRDINEKMSIQETSRREGNSALADEMFHRIEEMRALDRKLSRAVYAWKNGGQD